MTNVLICGLCPLPFENTHKSFGPGIRTWQFAHALSRAGHRVDLLAMQVSDVYDGDESAPSEVREGVTIHRLSEPDFFDADRIAAHIDRLRPDAVVGATVYGSNALAAIPPRVPFWADHFGHVMAEAQAKAQLEEQNWPLAYFWNLLEPTLRHADKISVVSNPQRWAAVGELGLAGRLTCETSGYEFTAVIPCAFMPRNATPTGAAIPDRVPGSKVVRGTQVPEDAFVALWSGGYNVWSDVDTLFRGLESAMARSPRIHFVSTGGSIDGHDHASYERFRERVAGSEFRSRFHLQGWVAAELVASYEAEADLGVLTEAAIYEGQLGSKNRVVQWLGRGLPALYNRVGELGSLLADEDLGLTFEVGDAAAMAERIAWAAEHPEELAAMRRRAQDHVAARFSIEATTRELVAWAERPRRAPDAELRQTVRGPACFADAAETTASESVTAPSAKPGAAAEASDFELTVRRIQEIEQRYRRARRQLDEIHGSKMWKLWMAYLAVRRWLLWPFERGRPATAATARERAE
jgi:glycosyltransferase involved in cell wall biosynthesis